MEAVPAASDFAKRFPAFYAAGVKSFLNDSQEIKPMRISEIKKIAETRSQSGKDFFLNASSI